LNIIGFAAPADTAAPVLATDGACVSLGPGVIGCCGCPDAAAPELMAFSD
jgi:hypothetical protein